MIQATSALCATAKTVCVCVCAHSQIKAEPIKVTYFGSENMKYENHLLWCLTVFWSFRLCNRFRVGTRFARCSKHGGETVLEPRKAPKVPITNLVTHQVLLPEHRTFEHTQNCHSHTSFNAAST